MNKKLVIAVFLVLGALVLIANGIDWIAGPGFDALRGYTP